VADNVEVVMPDIRGRRSGVRGLPVGARVVRTPSERDLDRIFIAPVDALSRGDALETLTRLRSSQRDTPVILFVKEGQHRLVSEVPLLQSLALAAGLHAPFFVAPDELTVTRIVRAHLAGAEKKLVAAARIREGQLWVWSCEPRLYRCNVSELVPLRDLAAAELESFEVSTSGSRLRWPDADVDLTLESIQAVADPGVRARHERQYREAARGYGQAIRRLRQLHRLAQSGIAGLSDRAVRRIEQGERIPHAATLEKLAGAHGMTVDRYMDALARLSGEGVSPTGPRKPRHHKPPRSRR
jgi:hypothetical protein